MTIKCREFIDITMLKDPHKRLRCAACKKEYYEIVDEHPCLYYKKADGSIGLGVYRSHLEEIV